VGHFLFACADNFVVGCIVQPHCTASQTNRGTDRQQFHANSPSYCMAVCGSETDALWYLYFQLTDVCDKQSLKFGSETDALWYLYFQLTDVCDKQSLMFGSETDVLWYGICTFS